MYVTLCLILHFSYSFVLSLFLSLFLTSRFAHNVDYIQQKLIILHEAAAVVAAAASIKFPDFIF